MGLIAEFRLQSADLALVDVVRAVPDCTITIEYNDQTFAGPIVTLIRVVGQSLDAVQTALENAEYVQELALISDEGSGRVYHIVTDGPWSAEMDELTFNKTLIERVRVTEDGWQLKQQFANRDELDAYRDSCLKGGADFRLDRLYESTGGTETVPGVSEKQREALLAAYEAGYFDVPREASLEDVAASLGIARSSLAERLHRGQAHLLEHYFYDDLYQTPYYGGKT